MRLRVAGGCEEGVKLLLLLPLAFFLLLRVARLFELLLLLLIPEELEATGFFLDAVDGTAVVDSVSTGLDWLQPMICYAAMLCCDAAIVTILFEDGSDPREQS